MSKQRPDPDKVANELAGASAFFRRPVPAPEPSEPSAASDLSPAPQAGDTAADRTGTPVTPATTIPPVRPVRDGRPARRIMIRHPFEIYADQLEGLRELSDRVKRQGENGSMSKMVRDAIDRLIDEHMP